MKSILVQVVSDNQKLISRICILLDDTSGLTQKYQVKSEDNCKEALRSLVGNEYDVYLIDHLLPNTKMTGIDLIKKANAGGCRSAILLVTNLSDDDAEMFVEDSGASGYLNKNFDLEDRPLKNAIRMALKYNREVADVREQLQGLQTQVAGLIRSFERR